VTASVPARKRRQALDPATLAEGVRAGDRRSVARAITVVENNEGTAEELISRLHRCGGKAFVLGITGPPGAAVEP